MSTMHLPTRYRRLLWAFAPAWRRQHGELTLSTLMEIHAAQGRSRPTRWERVVFTVVGLRSRLGRPVPVERHDPGASSRPSTWKLALRMADEGGGGWFSVDGVGPPLEIPLLRGDLYATAGLGAPDPVASFHPIRRTSRSASCSHGGATRAGGWQGRSPRSR